MSIKLYNLAQLVRLNTNPVTVTNTDASQQRVRLYQGQTCAVNFSVFNSTNRPLSMAGCQLVFKIWDVNDNSLLKTKTVTVVKNDVVKVTFDSNELIDIDPGYYFYTCNIITGEDENLILYMDVASEHKGFLEIIDTASNAFIASTELTQFNPSAGTYYSSAVNNVDKLRQRNNLHTYTVTVDDFTGTITAQATMVQAGVTTTHSDWFDVSDITLTSSTGTSTDTFSGVYSQIRFKYLPDVSNTGTVTKILYRS